MPALHLVASSADGALQKGLQKILFQSNLIKQDSRNGPVLRIPGMCITEYTNPRDRVLFSPIRDSNPFFSVFESLWMLAGRNDVAFPAKFAKQINAYSDDGETLNGAYGHRWRRHFSVDQLRSVIRELKKDPNSRRAHVQMWDGFHDTVAREDNSKDLPCNLSCEFQITNGRLDLTVYNRSNDLIWGAYGANLVHFSFLQEFIAGVLGFEVGTYYQVSTNTHIYTEFEITSRMIRQGISPSGYVVNSAFAAEPEYSDYQLSPPITFHSTQREGGVAEFDHALTGWLREFEINNDSTSIFKDYPSEFMIKVAEPMRRAWVLFKMDLLEDAVAHLKSQPVQYDWLLNSTQWLERRIARRAEKA